MAESKRRGEDAVDEDLDEELNDAVRDDALDDQDVDDDLDSDVDDLEDEDEDDLDEAPARVRGNGKAPAKATKGLSAKPDPKAKTKVDVVDRIGIFGRLLRFVREVVAELRKVIWPTRKELLTYTTVVVVFVTIMLSIVGGLDTAFAWLVLHVFGGKK